MPKALADARSGAPFTEKSFYLREFRGRTLGLAVSGDDLSARGPIEWVLKDLEANPTDVVLLCDDREALAGVLGTEVLETQGEGLEGRVWRALQRAPRVGLAVTEPLAATCHETVLRLGIGKLVWLDRAGGLTRADGSRISFLDLEDLAALRASGEATLAPRDELLAEIETALRAGLRAVNLCTVEGLANELFTYAGSGTLITRERYVDVRPLTLDDFSAAHDLITRGIAEGYLALRTPTQVDGIFAHGFGAFVESHHLAGIGALVPHESSGEIVSLYTLTRFLGEGIGGHLVRALCDRAAAHGDAFVFACTTTARVVGFFERHGFAVVPSDALPASKWRDYDEIRREQVVCLRRDLLAPG